MNLVTEALFHTNRFVRETGYNLLAALVLCVEVNSMIRRTMLENNITS
jgi:hypothetical protein